MRLVFEVRCGISCATFSAAPSPRPELAHLCLQRGLTLAALKDGSSPLHFNLLVDSLATNVRQFAPGVPNAASPQRFSQQLYADDLVAVADCEHDLQVTCDVVAEWAP